MGTRINEHFEAWGAFLRAGSTVLKTLAREMEEDQHLPLTWFDVLACLSHAPERRLRMQVLSNSMYLSNSGLTRLLNRMSSAELVERETCAEDRRGWYAVLTAKGREVFERVTPGHKRGVQKHFLNHLNDKDIRDLNRIMAKIVGTRNDQKTRESSISLKET